MNQRNIKTISVKPARIYNNPTWNRLFGRWQLKPNEWNELRVNHFHFSEIKRMASAFNYELNSTH